MTPSTRIAILGLACFSFTLAGCGQDRHPSYSTNLRYGIRQDPIVIEPKELGDDRYEPDRPGVLPLMNISDIQKPDHPYHKKKDRLEVALRDPRLLSDKDRESLEKGLEEMFGTPAHPKVDIKAGEGFDPKDLDVLKVDATTLAEGSKLYRVHCLHCHGVPGDGRGPTARWVNPHPRDFRVGLFKFQSIDRTTKDGNAELPASRADLLRTLRQGIEGTAMPSFNLLQDKELQDIISYVIHLGIRGKVEHWILKTNFKPKDGTLEYDQPNEPLSNLLAEYARTLAGYWIAAEASENRIIVEPYPYDNNNLEQIQASVKRGQQIFLAQISPEFTKEHALNVVTRPIVAKRMAEALAKKRESTQDPKAQLTALEKAEAQKLTPAELADAEKVAYTKESLEKAEGKLKGASCVSCHTNYGREGKYRVDTWGTLTRPNNFVMGTFRGGKRPVDIYYRIHSGINGYPMNGFGGTFKGNEEYLWDLVNFVSTLSYPPMRERLAIRID